MSVPVGASPEISPAHAWTGSRYINTADPQPQDMSLWDIATGLAREPRYGGAVTSIFWSVGQHSVLQVRLMREDGIEDPVLLRTALMHDAPEYMLRDMIAPVKRQCPDYKRLEGVWWAAMAERWDLPGVLPDIVKKYDLFTMGVEKAALISPRAGDWPGVPKVTERPIPNDLLFATMQDTFQEFLRESKILGIGQ